MLEAKRLSEVLKRLNASLHGDDALFNNVCIDSRQARAGTLFVALQGSRVNGHDYVGKARERGAVAALVEYLVDDPLPQLLVHDAQLALGELASLARDAFSGPLVAITGSSGKTSVKEMLASILREKGEVLATRGNLNNELGVPLTLLEIAPEHEYAVIEMGAAAIGDIAYSMKLARPSVSVLTNAGTAHVGRFGSPDNVARAKSEIYSGLDADGQAVINLDSPWFEQWYQLLGKRNSFAFSLENPTAQLRAESVELDHRGCPGFLLHTPRGAITVQLNVLGRHNIANALAAAGAALALNVELEFIRRGLAKVNPVPGRAQSLPGLAGSVVIDDSYNANPGSVKAAIDLLAAFQGRRILVLGDMGELGQWAEDSHREVGSYAAEQGLDALYAVGRYCALAVESFGEKARLFASKNELIDALRQQLDENVRVLVKGSRSAAMEEVVAALTIHNDNHNDDKAR